MLNWYRRWKEIRAAKIVDCSHMKKMPERSRLHLVFTILYAIAMVAVLWQHCHPVITILILALILPLSLPAYVPYARLGFSARFVIQLLLVMFALLWSFYRLKTGTLMDKVCVELLGIAGTTFLMGRRSRDYGYLFLMSMFLLIYGALLPRLLFLYLFAGAVVCILAIFYYNRPLNLAGDPEIRHPPLRPAGTWYYFGIHAVLTLVFFVGIFMLLPKLPTRTEGAFEVSFFTDKDSMLPIPMQKWLHNEKKELKMNPQAPLQIRTGKPNTLSTSGSPVKVKNAPAAATKAEGDGGGAAQGEDLLFTVKSPVKLYHVARIYNEYDGSVWRISPQLKQPRGHRLRASEREPASMDIELRYTIRKWISPRLFAPYLPVSFNSSNATVRILPVDLVCGELAGRNYPALPYNYKVSTRIFLPGAELPPGMEEDTRKVSFWLEGVSEYRYMALPLEKISERLRALVNRLTEGKNSDLEKALALRDYLRENIPYKLYSDPIPEGRECADYFIFELKTGHCEYYATALAVMARLAGLPSRVATGFSPGNYNTLTNQFEVYEYHAHAWTQIFVEDRGWLTLDATPPQSLVSRTTPAGIGTLRDPFGDEWKMTPPELTEKTQTYAKELYRERMKEKTVELTKVEEILSKTLLKEEDSKKEKAKKPLPKKGLAGRLNEFLKESNQNLREFLNRSLEFAGEKGGLILVLLLPVLSLLLLVRILIVSLRQRLLLKKAKQCFVRASDRTLTPEQRVRALYWGTRLLLNRANLPRRHNQELLEYAGSLASVDPLLARNTEALFECFYQIEYGGCSFDEFDVRNLYGKVRPIRQILTRIIRGGR